MLSKMMNSSKMTSLKTRMISRSGANPAGTTARKFSQVIGGQEGSQVSYPFQLINLGNIFDW
jgi:hypothetical protein